MSAGLTKGAAPIYPLPAGESISDPLVQAMTLTAIVISFGVATLVLSLVYRVYDSHHSVDLRRLGSAEAVQASLDDQPTALEIEAEEEARVSSEDEEAVAATGARS
jgi:multicomponent Na+:H+ antiporter subunit C